MQSTGKPCHNCRRRRLRCDRSWPTCHKCAVSGQECLGYGKVFVWTQGIDEHGNLKPSPSGRRTASISASASASASTSATASASASTSAFGSASASACSSNAPSARSTPNPPPLPSPSESRPFFANLSHNQLRQQEQDLEHRRERERGYGQGLEHEYYEQHQEAQANYFHGSAASSRPESPVASDAETGGAGASSGGALTDPLFQDLDRPSRYYLAYFADRVCQDLVARDDPVSNPFRELLPLTKKHPLLLQILIATSAIHWSNIFRPITDIPTNLTNPGGYLAQLRSKDLVSRKALIDALTAKQKAMGHLREVLDTLDPAGSEVALAAMHFFIKFDLIDLEKSDSSGWKAHLEGAASIMALMTREHLTPASSRMLRDTVIADCFIYHILGSTLSSGGLAARIARYAFELLPVMKRVEVNSYLSCPPEILKIILVASQLSYETPCSTDWSLPAADEALALIDQALNFDINAWASHLQTLPHVTDIESRIHVASAHRSAACLYILQALPLVRSVRPVDADFLVADILSHLAAVGEDDPYFKATSWPTFIAGAETRDPEKRTWTLKRMLAIFSSCRWGYVFTAIEMLKATWQLQDATGQSGDGVHWLRDLKGLGFEHLIV